MGSLHRIGPARLGILYRTGGIGHGSLSLYLPTTQLVPHESYIVTDASKVLEACWTHAVPGRGTASLLLSRKEHAWNYQNETCWFRKHGFKLSHWSLCSAFS